VSEKTLAARVGAPVAPATPSHPEVAAWRTATEGDIDGIHAVLTAADAVDHPTWITPREDVADTFDLPQIDHTRDTILALDPEGTVIGFGSAFLHPARTGTLAVSLGGAVAPAWRRRGIGSAVLEWQRARGLEQVAEVAPGLEPGDWDAELKVFAEDVNVDQQKLATDAGFTPERWFATMVRDLAGPLPEPAEVEGIRVVAYTPDRELDMLAARNDAFRDHWGSLPSSEEWWHKFVGGPFFRGDLSRLALDAHGAIVAFCLASVNEEDWVALGASNSYIDLIGVIRSHRRRGLAPLVVSRSLAAIADAGLEKAVLDVDTASPTGAHTLYEGLGFAATERSVALVQRI